MSVSRKGLVATSIGCKILFGGGSDFSNLVSFSTIDIYDIYRKEWYIIRSGLSIGRSLMSVVTLNNTAYFIGGFNYDTNAPSNVVDYFTFDCDNGINYFCDSFY